MTKKIKCEVYTRACGYYRPVNQMNPGKRQEVKEREMINVDEIIEDCKLKENI